MTSGSLRPEYRDLLQIQDRNQFCLFVSVVETFDQKPDYGFVDEFSVDPYNNLSSSTDTVLGNPISHFRFLAQNHSSGLFKVHVRPYCRDFPRLNTWFLFDFSQKGFTVYPKTKSVVRIVMESIVTVQIV